MSRNYFSKLITQIPVLVTLIVACGKLKQTTIASEGFGTTGNTIASWAAPTTTVTDFKICVKRIKLEGEDGSAIKKEGETGENGESDPEDIRFAPGLIDLSDGTAKDWGSVEIPTGFRLKKIQIKVHKDKGLCGVDYSLKFNSSTTSQNLEIKFRFDPAVESADIQDKLVLSFQEVVDNLRKAVDANTINSLKDRVEEVEGTASIK